MLLQSSNKESELLMTLLEAEEKWNEDILKIISLEHNRIINEEEDFLLLEGETLEAVKNFFKKIWEGFTKFLKWAWGEISSVFMKMNNWVKKYKEKIIEGAKKAAGAGRKVEWKLREDIWNNYFIKAINEVFHLVTIGFQKIAEDPANDFEKIITDYKDHLSELFTGDKEITHISKINFSIAYVTGNSLSIMKRNCAKFKDSIKKLESEAMNSIKGTSDEEVKKLVNYRKYASYLIKFAQLDYSTERKVYLYHYNFCKTCYNYLEFGSSKPKI